MSIEAIAWALNEAPVPPGKPGLVLVLIGLANNADAHGKHAFPSNETLCRYTRMSERGVRAALRELEAAGLIVRGDQDVVRAHIKAGPRHLPLSYNLRMDRTRSEGQSVPLANSEGQSVPPRGAVSAASEGQSLPIRGAETAPEPSFNRPSEPSTQPSAAASPAAPVVDLFGTPVEAKPEDPAKALTQAWWEEYTPRPSTSYIGQERIVRKFLAQGWQAGPLLAAMRRAGPPLYTASLERELRRTSPNGALGISDWDNIEGAGWAGQ